MFNKQNVYDAAAAFARNISFGLLSSGNEFDG